MAEGRVGQPEFLGIVAAVLLAFAIIVAVTVLLQLQPRTEGSIPDTGPASSAT